MLHSLYHGYLFLGPIWGSWWNVSEITKRANPYLYSEWTEMSDQLSSGVCRNTCQLVCAPITYVFLMIDLIASLLSQSYMSDNEKPEEPTPEKEQSSENTKMRLSQAKQVCEREESDIYKLLNICDCIRETMRDKVCY